MQQTNQDAQKFSQGRINILMQATKNMTKKQMEQDKIESLFQEDLIAKKKDMMTEFSQMFEQSLQDRDYKVGDIVKGKIVEVQTDYVPLRRRCTFCKTWRRSRSFH
jgi:transcriptional regulator CtsR